MLSGLLPGLRELRAPLAGGYLWLLLFWLTFGGQLPTTGEKKPPPLDRLYRLEPIVSDLGVAVVASVVAYIVGSIAIDIQVRLARGPIARLRVPTGSWVRPAIVIPVLAGLGLMTVITWILPDGSFTTVITALAVIIFLFVSLIWVDVTNQEHDVAWMRARSASGRRDSQVTDEGWSQLLTWLSGMLQGDHVYSKLGKLSLEYIARNRSLLKTRVLDVSAALHSEIDRPDAEATFRLATWPPIAALVTYLAVAVSPWWIFALVIPTVLAWQSISLRKQANDALVTALVARDKLSEPLFAEVKRQIVSDAARSAVQRARKDEDCRVEQVTLDENQDTHEHTAQVRRKDGSKVDVRLDRQFIVTDIAAPSPKVRAEVVQGAN